MARRKKLLKILFGVLIGILVSKALNFATQPMEMCFSKKVRKKPIDPLSLFETENDPNKNLLFVGVMTASKYLENRAKAVFETWGNRVPGKIIFFSSETSYTDSVPLVTLAGVDDSYPPQKKSFRMLKYMHDHYIDKYEWFLRADDDVYVKTNELETFLRSIDSSKPWFIGQTGRGNTEEFGLLSLEHDENFCMGGPGVILSRETLRRIAPYLNDCLDNLYTTHEDVELGRCVKKYAGVSCTWSYEMQAILYHNQSGEYAFSGDLKQKEIHRAITLHPVKQPQHMYRLHKYVQGLQIQNNQQESIHLHRDIALSMSKLNIPIEKLNEAKLVENMKLFEEPPSSENYLGDPIILGVPVGLNRYAQQTFDDLLDWELIAKSLYSYKDFNPKRRLGSATKEGLNDIIREIMELINSFSKQRGRIIDFKDIFYGYWRLNPIYGVDLILDLLLVYRKYRGRKMTVPVRRHAYVQQSFTGVEVREININTHLTSSKTELPRHKKLIKQIISKLGDSLPKISLFQEDPRRTKVIHFIVPLSGRHQTLKRFLSMYEDVCLRTTEYTTLLIVLYKNDDLEFESNKKLIEILSSSYGSSSISYMVLEGSFSRGQALYKGVNLYKNDDLLFFVDVDIVFSSKTLQRIRQNTLESKKVYFPIVYSLYNPKAFNRTFNFEDYKSFKPELLLDENSGFWRQFGFGIVSLYKSDFVKLGGFNVSITGWGMEDVSFYDNVIKSPLRIIRSIDPDLIHVYHPVVCDNNLDITQKNMCLGTKASTFGSLHDLQEFIKRNKYLFR